MITIETTFVLGIRPEGRCWRSKHFVHPGDNRKLEVACVVASGHVGTFTELQKVRVCFMTPKMVSLYILVKKLK
jgi:hypothetical protein